ncbi:glycosyltransferase family 2 protein [Leeuwenhoekiella aequorea]|uniref:Glycosyl transferase family 2 n=1 Tax=Leeuwenhoekiella aequorea TaxID=283736 RepID=A0A4Q0P755_9FLAO|nr:glycosyltransferase family A protein [Leeuwenhoekiella aequorea]RXG22514.1 glycosyl transferase family 2 [Leeuwenhoekiella aequorea]
MPRITVVIPLYNKQNYICDTLKSVYAQTYTNYEILIINDGSTDSSSHYIEKIIDKRNTRIIHQSNHGLSNARNTGIKFANSEIICLLDADDLWLPTHLAQIIELVTDFPEAKIYATAYLEFYRNGKSLKPKTNIRSTLSKFIVQDFFESSLYQPFITPSSFAFKKEIIDQIGGFDTQITYAEDTDFFIRANLNLQLAYFNKPSCYYRSESENQITRSTLSSKKAPDFLKYRLENPNHQSLRRYINLQYYYLSNYCKIEAAHSQYKEVYKNIDLELLNYKQRFLIKAPKWLLQSLRFVKQILLDKGKRITTF